MSENPEKITLFFTEPCVDINLSNVPLQIINDLGLTQINPCIYGDNDKFNKLYKLIEFIDNSNKCKLKNEYYDYSINPAGSLANTFYTINRLSGLSQQNIKIVFPYPLNMDDKIEKMFIDKIEEEKIEPIYLAETNDKIEQRIIKVCCMLSEELKDKEKRMISSKMTTLELNDEVKKQINNKLCLTKDIIIEGFFYNNNEEVVNYILEQAKYKNTKVGLTLSAGFIPKNKNKEIIRYILDKKINQIYGNEEEIFELFQSDHAKSKFKEYLNDFGNVDLKKLSEKYNLTILETKGKNGSILYEEGKEIVQNKSFIKDENEIINTMGAGDTFLAGFLEARGLDVDNENSLYFATILAEEILQKPYGSLSKEDINTILFPNEQVTKELIKYVTNLQLNIAKLQTTEKMEQEFDEYSNPIEQIENAMQDIQQALTRYPTLSRSKKGTTPRRSSSCDPSYK